MKKNKKNAYWGTPPMLDTTVAESSYSNPSQCACGLRRLVPVDIWIFTSEVQSDSIGHQIELPKCIFTAFARRKVARITRGTIPSVSNSINQYTQYYLNLRRNLEKYLGIVWCDMSEGHITIGSSCGSICSINNGKQPSKSRVCDIILSKFSGASSGKPCSYSSLYYEEVCPLHIQCPRALTESGFDIDNKRSDVVDLFSSTVESTCDPASVATSVEEDPLALAHLPPVGYQYVFVYGTLKRGFCNHYNLQAFGVEYLQAAETIEPFVMYLDHTNRYRPCLTGGDLHSIGVGTPVQGELFMVSDQLLPELDMFERCPVHYKRVGCAIKGKNDGRSYTAQVYICNTSEERWREILGGAFELVRDYTFEHHRKYTPRSAIRNH